MKFDYKRRLNQLIVSLQENVSEAPVLLSFSASLLMVLVLGVINLKQGQTLDEQILKLTRNRDLLRLTEKISIRSETMDAITEEMVSRRIHPSLGFKDLSVDYVREVAQYKSLMEEVEVGNANLIKFHSLAQSQSQALSRVYKLRNEGLSQEALLEFKKLKSLNLMPLIQSLGQLIMESTASEYLLAKQHRDESLRSIQTITEVVILTAISSLIFGVMGLFHRIRSLRLESTRKERTLKELEARVAKRTQELWTSEELFRQAVRVANLGMFDHDLINEKLYCSDQMLLLSGFAPKSSISLSQFLERVYPADRAVIEESIRKSHESQSSGVVSFEHRLLLPDGTVNWISTNAQTFFEGQGSNRRAVRSIGVTLNITERKKSEQVIQKTLDCLAIEKNKLEESNRILERFASVAAHDLRAPVRAIGLWIEMFEEILPSTRNSEMKEMLGYIKLNAIKSSALIEDLLEIARVKHSESQSCSVDLNLLLKNLLASLNSNKDKNQVEWRLSSLPVVHGNESQLESVFGNLIRNAITYRDRNRDSVVGIELQENANEFIFCVRDNGIGIDPKYHDKIFEMFERLHSDQEYPGTGIGLALCKKIVEGWGGKIWLKSQVNQGSSFFFSYPKVGMISERRSA
jgi:PAS domain S-box-containing protein